MSEVSAFLRKSDGGFTHWCPACKHAHRFRTEPFGDAPVWTFNGDVIKPTFAPSMLIFVPAAKEWTGPMPRKVICHYILTDGQIQFCGDSPHALSGQTVPLPPLSDAGDYGWGD